MTEYLKPILLNELELRDKHNQKQGLFKCCCGNEFISNLRNIQINHTKSCGCLKKRGSRLRHGQAETQEYSVWCDIKKRCYNIKYKRYDRYGGRGIKVCDRWLDKNRGFENFLKDMGQKPFTKAQLDRIDNNGDYSPENCRWTTPKINSRNRSNNVLITVFNKTQSQSAWAEEFNISVSTLRKRIGMGWDIESALLKPVEKVTSRSEPIEYNGKLQSKRALAKEYNIPYGAFLRRLKLGWVLEEALKTPLSPRTRKGD